jgi:hypothetical protein
MPHEMCPLADVLGLKRMYRVLGHAGLCRFKFILVLSGRMTVRTQARILS